MAAGAWRRTARPRSTSPRPSAARSLVIGLLPAAWSARCDAPGVRAMAIVFGAGTMTLTLYSLHVADADRLRPARGDALGVPVARRSRCWGSARSTSTAGRRGPLEWLGGELVRPRGRTGAGRRPTDSVAVHRPRSALVWPRCFFASSRRCLAPRVGFVGRRFGGGGASAVRRRSASRSRAATRLRCCERCSEASTTTRPSVSRSPRLRTARARCCIGERRRTTRRRTPARPGCRRC